MALNPRRLAKITRYGIFACIATVSGVLLAVQKNDSSLNQSVLLDFETSTASADTPDSGTGTADSGSGDSGSSDSGSGDSGSGDCGSGDSGSGDSGDGCGDGCG